MRLTLRTLLAWLDDTLPAAEVRQIGHQVAESTFAQELVERIHRVARQRRLTVPNGTGADVTDPNLVASYLDNELEPEQVAEYEKRCLTSDVHLAEVASTHQILSLIGQKAKVPVEARHRMYRLVKGREAVSSKVPRAFSPPADDPLTEPLVPWAPPPPPRRSLAEQYGPAAFVVLLIAVLGWSTWMSLNPGPGASRDAGLAQVLPKQDGGATQPKRAGEPSAAAAGAETKANAGGTPAEPQSQSVTKEDGAEKSASSSQPSGEEASQTSDLPPGALGVVEDSDGILLRHNAGSRVWERVKPQSSLKEDDRILSLDHYRNSIRLGSAHLTLAGDSELRIHKPEKGLTAQFDLVHGRLVVASVDPPAPIGVNLADQVLKLTPVAGAPVGLQAEGTEASTSELRIFAPQGEVKLAAGDATETLNGPGLVIFTAPGKFTRKESKDVPSWVTDPSPSPLDKQIGEQFAKNFKSDREVMKNLVEAMDDEQKDIRQLAIATLGRMGEVGLVISALSRADDGVSRRAAIQTLRSLLTHNAESAKLVRTELAQSLGETEAEIVEKLLTGYSTKEAHEESTYSKLVQLLSSPDPGVRELALDNLETLTGRHDLGYSVDKPEGDGLKHWQDLLRRKELRPLAAPPAAK
jgi:hypothetical protein